MFSNHESLNILRPHFHSYAKKLIKISENEENEENEEMLNIELYAKSIYYRAGALQNAYETLCLSIEYLEQDDFNPSKFDFASHHQYHLEHFHLSLFGVIDRCYLLVGSAIVLEDSKIEKIGGKSSIEKRLKSEKNLAGILNALEKLNSNVNSLKETRNAIAHKNSLSNEHLEALGYFTLPSEISSKVFKDIKLSTAENTIKEGLIKKTKKEIEILKNNLESDLKSVLQSLSIIYSAVELMYTKKNDD